MRSLRSLFLALLALVVLSGPAFAGSIFITGHDPIWHAHQGSNKVGANKLATTGIEFARDGDTTKFLFIESITAPIPSGNLRTASFLQTDLGYTAADYDVMDGAALAALPDFRATLNSYSAIVVASDHGGMLTSAELLFLNAHSADIIDYLNAGGGLYAESESNATGQIGGTPRFGFLPFLVASSDFQASEISNVVTAFGAGLGLVNADVNGNFSHNFFASTGGMNIVDLFNNDPNRPLTLAIRSQIDPGGVVDAVPEPASIVLLLTGAAGVLARRRSRRR